MPGKKPAGKKGPSAAALAALKARKEKEQEEERLRQQQEEEERLRQEEEARLEEERKQAELRAKQRQDDSADRKKNQASAAERKRQEEAKKRLERMQKEGMHIPEALLKKLSGESSGDKNDKKKKTETLAQKKKRLEKEKAEREAQKVEEELQKQETENKEEEEEEDDWEAQMEQEEANAEPEQEQEQEPEEEADDEPEPEREAEKQKSKHVDPKEKTSPEDLRSPICCVLGHVDTGKTKLLDYIRRTNVQTGEAGGITQQIGASFFPSSNLIQKTKELIEYTKKPLTIDVPGLLVIDTPGHEAFANLRGRGSALCDIAILVVDIMHGLEPQTRESIKLLKSRNTPFIVALNKIDRLYDWEPTKAAPFPITYKAQKDYIKDEFQSRMNQVILQLNEEGLNACLYTENKNFKKVVSLVPTSAHTGEGVPDLLLLMVQLSQRYMNEKLTITDELNCSLLEVKKIEGHGVTIDVILVNGVLHEGDTIVICGLNGPIVTQIRALLTPYPMKEIRVKGEYMRHKQIRAAQGIKIAATGLEEAVPGTPVLRYRDGDDLEKVKNEVMSEFSTISRKQGDLGVAVQASTLGALEALLVFLEEVKVPVSTIGVGELHKKDIMRAVGIKEKNPKYACILCFDVEISKEARQVAEKEDIKIFTADIIYHLEEKFNTYLKEYTQKLMEKNKDRAIFPCRLSTFPDKVAHNKDPFLLGMKVIEGQLRIGTPLFALKEGKPFTVGKVESLQKDFKDVKVAKDGEEVSVKIKTEGNLTFGRQVTVEDDLMSLISRESIDALKESFMEEMETKDWKLIIKLKKVLGVI